jgi:hypothetical protein
MSGDDIPYHLRPNKYIDRQLFLESLLRLVVPAGPEKYIYISMGGNHLVDHYSVYSQLGIEALYSFDKKAHVVKRQKLNRPTGNTICVELNTADLHTKLDDVLNRFPSKKNLIVWLDYTSTKRRTQLQQAVQTLLKLRHGDVFRITLNADAHSLSEGDEWLDAGVAGPGEHRAAVLRDQVKEYFPTNVTSINEDELPTVLARCIELATKEVTAAKPDIEISPVLLTAYGDGSRMLTATCVVSDLTVKSAFPPESFSRWRYASQSWTDIRRIYAPVLSLREKNRLDSRLHRGASNALKGLRFLFEGSDDEKALEKVRSYRTYHRFYPTFRPIEE